MRWISWLGLMALSIQPLQASEGQCFRQLDSQQWRLETPELCGQIEDESVCMFKTKACWISSDGSSYGCVKLDNPNTNSDDTKEENDDRPKEDNAHDDPDPETDPVDEPKDEAGAGDQHEPDREANEGDQDAEEGSEEDESEERGEEFDEGDEIGDEDYEPTEDEDDVPEEPEEEDPESELPPADDLDESSCDPNLMGEEACTPSQPQHFKDEQIKPEPLDLSGPIDCAHPLVHCMDEEEQLAELKPEKELKVDGPLDCSHPQVKCGRDESMAAQSEGRSLVVRLPTHDNGLDCSNPEANCVPQFFEKTPCDGPAAKVEIIKGKLCRDEDENDGTSCTVGAKSLPTTKQLGVVCRDDVVGELGCSPTPKNGQVDFGIDRKLCYLDATRNRVCKKE